MKLKKNEFIEHLNTLTNEDVVTLAITHMLSKNFNDDDFEMSVFLKFLSDYNNYTKFLNDYMGIICKRYSTDMDEIYRYTCDIFDLEWDNKSLFDFRLNRILINTPARVLSINNSDLVELNLEHLEEELEVLLDSKYFKENGDSFEKEIQIAQKNIETIKKSIDS